MRKYILSLIFIFTVRISTGQSLPQKIADAYFEDSVYSIALKYYLDIARETQKFDSYIYRRIVLCYEKINNHKKAVYWYKKIFESGEQTVEDISCYYVALRNCYGSRKPEKKIVKYTDAVNETLCLAALSVALAH